MITVNVNQNKHQIPENTRLNDLLSHLQISPFGIAIAINSQVIPKKEWSNYGLSESEDILIIKATQGG